MCTILGVAMGMTGCRQRLHRPSPVLSAYPPFLAEDPLDVDARLARMSVDEQIGQLIMLRVCGEPGNQLYKLARSGRIGGMILYDLNLSRFLVVSDSVKRLSRQPFWLGTEEPLTLNNQFNDVVGFPDETTLQAAPAADTLRDWLSHIYPAQAEAAGLHISMSMRVPEDSLSEENCAYTICDELDRIVGFNQRHIATIGRSLRPNVLAAYRDTTALLDSLLRPYRQLIRQGVSGFWIDRAAVLFAKQQGGFASRFVRQKLNFGGLLVGEASGPEMAERMLFAGVDILVADEDPEPVYQYLRKIVRSGVLPRAVLEEKVRRILLAKSWSFHQAPALQGEAPVVLTVSLNNRPEAKVAVDRKRVLAHFNNENWQVLNHRLYESSIALVHRRRKLAPFKNLYNRRFRILQYGGAPAKTFIRQVAHFAAVDTGYVLSTTQWRTQLEAEIDSAAQYTYLLVMDQPTLDARRDSAFLIAAQRMAQRTNVAIVHFGDEQQLGQLDTAYAIVHAPERNDFTESLTAQLLFSAAAAQGRIPLEMLSKFDYSREGLPKVTRLQYSRPSLTNIAPERLAGIDAIVNSAIDKGTMPGCQVVVAHRGQVIYSKAFGYHTYTKQIPVQVDDLYDIASVTKVVATTMTAMHFYEEKEFRLNDKLRRLIDLGRRSTLRDITVKKLMIHQSGLQANMPVVPYLLYREIPGKDCKEGDFCKTSSRTFSLEVADSFYFNKINIPKIWNDTYRLRVDRRAGYRYSDVNFFLVEKFLEPMMKKPIDVWTRNNIYLPLGLRHITFKPLDYFERDQITPTEDDKRWRKQLVQGHVHDETAALFGGVAGNAGLFSNAEDLAALFQLLLNGGQYGGVKLLKSSTIELFTSAEHGNHRGLGFDKPDKERRSAHARSAPLTSFGHTGFTGTCVWADPDNQLIFVFLSNRVYPDARNRLLFRDQVRERAHQVVYDALNSYHFELPEV